MAPQRVVVLWVDATFRGSNYSLMVNEFSTQISCLQQIPSSTDEIDRLICNTQNELTINGAIVITVDTPMKLTEKIKDYANDKIFIISSGSIGKTIVPDLVKNYPLLHSYYIFCFEMEAYVNWAMEYASCLRMFNHPIDLLVRLMRDIALCFLRLGEAYLESNDPVRALEYFEYSKNLEIKANQKNKRPPNSRGFEEVSIESDYRGIRNLLDGENGLIEKAKNKALQ